MAVLHAGKTNGIDTAISLRFGLCHIVTQPDHAQHPSAGTDNIAGTIGGGSGMENFAAGIFSLLQPFDYVAFARRIGVVCAASTTPSAVCGFHAA